MKDPLYVHAPIQPIIHHILCSYNGVITLFKAVFLFSRISISYFSIVYSFFRFLLKYINVLGMERDCCRDNDAYSAHCDRPTCYGTWNNSRWTVNHHFWLQISCEVCSRTLSLIVEIPSFGISWFRRSRVVYRLTAYLDR